MKAKWHPGTFLLPLTSQIEVVCSKEAGFHVGVLTAESTKEKRRTFLIFNHIISK